MDRKECKLCRKFLPTTYEEDYCPHCKEIILFSKVKEYIRSNTVNEFQVSEHFGIPLRKIKSWIREGRIEYALRNTDDGKKMSFNTCVACGLPIKSGQFCPKCESLKSKADMFGLISHNPSNKNDKMMFLKDKDKKR